MSATLRAGVIGFGWAGQQHLSAYSELPGVEVVGIAGQEPEVGARLAEEHGVANVVADGLELLDLDLDVVSIAVPTFLHAPLSIAALDAGVHVLCEKPIARDGEEAETMVDAARRAGRVLEVAFNHRLRGDVTALKEILAEGGIGAPYHAKASWMRRRGIPGLGSWFTSKERSGGGPLADIGVHALDWALHLLDEPEVLAVSAVAHSQLGRRGLGGWDYGSDSPAAADFDVEDLVSAFLRLDSGRSLTLETSWAAFRDEDDLMDFSVFGTEGGADLVIRGATATPRGTVRVYRDADGIGADYDVPVAEGRHHLGVVEDFLAVVADPATWPAHDGSTALRRARVIDACYLSAAQNTEVTL